MSTVRTRAVDRLREFVQTEAAGGVVLPGAAPAALVWASSLFSGTSRGEERPCAAGICSPRIMSARIVAGAVQRIVILYFSIIDDQRRSSGALGTPLQGNDIARLASGPYMMRECPVVHQMSVRPKTERSQASSRKRRDGFRPPVQGTALSASPATCDRGRYSGPPGHLVASRCLGLGRRGGCSTLAGRRCQGVMFPLHPA